MFYSNVHFLSILVASIVSAGLGALWYSPILFLKPWITAKGKTLEEVKANQKSLAPKMVVNFIGILISVYVLAVLLGSTLTLSIFSSLGTTLFVVIGIYGGSKLNDYLFHEQKPVIIAIDAGYHVAYLLISAAILYYF